MNSPNNGWRRTPNKFPLRIMNPSEPAPKLLAPPEAGNPGFSRLGLGTGMLASWRGGLSPADTDRLVSTAGENGVTLIDTADSYASGECERLLGRVLKDRRDDFLLMTKAGYSTADLPGPLHRFNPLAKKILHRFGPRQNFEPFYLECALGKSLRRLRMDHVDVFLLHDPPAECLADGRVFDKLDSLKRKGLAKMIGVSSGDEDALTLALEWQGCEVIQTPFSPNSMISGTIHAKQAEGLVVILNHVSLGGRLPGNGDDSDPEILLLRSRILARADQSGTGPHAALLNVALEVSGASSVLTGTRSISHLLENCKAVHSS